MTDSDDLAQVPDEDIPTDTEDTDDSSDSEHVRAEQPGADPEDAEQIEKERQERLDPDNRPEGAEVDNTGREFDAEKAMFKDAEGYEEAEAKFPPSGEQG